MCLLNLFIAANCALAAAHHWHTGGFSLAASILGALFFLLAAYFCGHYVATGRRHFRLSE